jgi:hypothetical protein
MTRARGEEADVDVDVDVHAETATDAMAVEGPEVQERGESRTGAVPRKAARSRKEELQSAGEGRDDAYGNGNPVPESGPFIKSGGFFGEL